MDTCGFDPHEEGALPSSSAIIFPFSSVGRTPDCYRPNRDELKMLIRNQSFVEIGKKYGVSDNAIRKWCKTENLPSTKKEINIYSNEEWENV